ncbi:MAG: hypothetical protein LQ351_001313 [Letrouitia transgressa]|nr:MAG: hypothetical protein LQ351_001313 [Letrouitia transgressa]
MEFFPVLWVYSFIQWVLDKLLSPTPPPPRAILSRPRIAVIGAGLTGVSSASHCVGHGFDVTIFEAGDEQSLGGIWSPKTPHMPNQDAFKGDIFHSSQLDGKTASGKKVLIVGGGASAVEVLEFATHTDAASSAVLARSDKWVIPRNAFVNGLLALNIFGQETLISWVPETLLRKFFYRDLEDLAPASRGLFTETPMVNSNLFQQIRDKKADWFRGDIIEFVPDGIRFRHRAKGVPKGGPGRESVVKGDMIIMATGYQRPSLAFLPDAVFQEPYQPPKWYLQVFPPEHMSICANNCTYVNAIATAGNYHIGIYTRLLLMFLVDPLARPHQYWMKRWIDMTQWIKSRAPTGAFDFITYSELIYWFIFCIAINPFRWKWAPFVLFGIGATLPKHVVSREDELRNGLGIKNHHHE